MLKVILDWLKDMSLDHLKIKTIKQQIGDLNTQMKVFISGGTIREKAIENQNIC